MPGADGIVELKKAQSTNSEAVWDARLRIEKRPFQSMKYHQITVVVDVRISSLHGSPWDVTIRIQGEIGSGSSRSTTQCDSLPEDIEFIWARGAMRYRVRPLLISFDGYL